METPAPASTENLPAVKPQPVTSTRPSLTSRQEAFCHAMAGGVGGAEAARRAGYSGNGAKQRGAFLMRQPEIRVRIDEIRASRQAAVAIAHVRRTCRILHNARKRLSAPSAVSMASAGNKPVDWTCRPSPASTFSLKIGVGARVRPS